MTQEPTKRGTTRAVALTAWDIPRRLPFLFLADYPPGMNTYNIPDQSSRSTDSSNKSTPTHPTERTARLAAFEATCRDLWPYVRHFAMAGACLEAIDAVAALGELLGETSDNRITTEAVDQVRQDTIDEVARWLHDSSAVRGRIGSKAAKSIAEQLQNLAASDTMSE